LWLAAGLSYYKAAAPSHIEVVGSLTSLESAWAAELLTYGLGEFAAANNLDLLRPGWEHRVHEVDDGADVLLPRGEGRPMVAVGGGKDSCVTIEALDAAGFDPLLCSVRSFPVIDAVVEASGRPSVKVGRTIDPALVELNHRGALNGHVPVTSIVSLALVLAALRNDCGAVVMSNERSSSEATANWRGEAVNHQWSKSLAAEDRLATVLAAATGGEGPAWFSLLRPFGELAITRLFAERCERFFESFSSCNAAFRLDAARRTERWDGNCPKCRFVALALAPWLSRAQVVGIQGHDVLDDPSQVDGLLALVEAGQPKPFECVGEVAESRVAVGLAEPRDGWSDAQALRTVADRLRSDGLWPSSTDASKALAPDLGLAHLVPKRFRPIVEELALASG
jgi:hypothetical protein